MTTHNKAVSAHNLLSAPMSSISSMNLLTGLSLSLIIALGAFLRFYQLGEHSIGNTYYAATVQSMLTSWHNFFFVAYEPGGSVTVDKPPLGFWVQATSAYFLGVNGFALALPQALAGVLSIPLLFIMVRRPFGNGAGLMAALVLATMPVTISTERNNTIDGLLLFVLLLATWAILQAVYSKSVRYLLLGAFFIGIGFNIKMMQAFLPLPALYAVYWFGMPHRWSIRLFHLSGATLLLIAVSLSWAIAVDLTPPDQRPFVGSSTNNTVMELIVGHNGLNRLFGGGGPGRQNGPPPANNDGQPRQSAIQQNNPPSTTSRQPGINNGPPPPQFQANQSHNEGKGFFSFLFGPPPERPSNGNAAHNHAPPHPGFAQIGQNPPPSGDRGDGRRGQGRPPGGGPQGEIGSPSPIRLLTEPLVMEAGWLLPLALFGVPMLLTSFTWTGPLTEQHLAFILWGGWLMTEVIFFSVAQFYHAYYLIMLGPPVAALVGMTVWRFWQIIHDTPQRGWAYLTLLLGGLLLFQAIMIVRYPPYGFGVMRVAILFLLSGIGLAYLSKDSTVTRYGAITLMLMAVLVAPLTWSILTTFNQNPDVMLPQTGPDTGRPPRPDAVVAMSPQQQVMVDYLLENTAPDSYLLATPSSHEASALILTTQRPVLTFGGFNGGDDVVDTNGLADLVNSNALRFVLGGGKLTRSKPDIAIWLTKHCTEVQLPGGQLAQPSPPQPNRGGLQFEQSPHLLYDCG